MVSVPKVPLTTALVVSSKGVLAVTSTVCVTSPGAN